MFTLNLARYRFVFKVTEPILLPEYAGSALRGVFGRSLMQLSGLNRQDVAEKTPLFLYSPYAAVFEPQPSGQTGILSTIKTPPVPYVIKAPSCGRRFWDVGDEFSFEMTVLGEALEHLPIIILAWRRALLRGIGKDSQGQAELIGVYAYNNKQQQELIYSEEKPVVAVHEKKIQTPSFQNSLNVSLTLTTPLRLQRKNKVVDGSSLTADIFLRSIVRRVLLYKQIFNRDTPLNTDFNQLNALADGITSQSNFKRKNWTRYSTRQKQLMELDGVVGEWTLFDVPKELLPYLWIGQFLHVGKNTSFGLGGYNITHQSSTVTSVTA